MSSILLLYLLDLESVNKIFHNELKIIAVTYFLATLANLYTEIAITLYLST